MHAPKGETPVAYVVGGARRKLSMISTVTNHGKTSWMIIDDNPNHVRLIEFFEALIKQAGRRFFLVLDNLGVHHCKPAKQWLAVHVKHIEVFCLPSYSPELNSDERLNGDETAAWIVGMARLVDVSSQTNHLPLTWQITQAQPVGIKTSPQFSLRRNLVPTV